MELKEIAAISGKPGLFKVIKPTRSGVIVESLDEKKIKTVVGTSHRVSVLKEVSIYTTDKEGSIALEQVLHRMYEKFKENLPLDAKSTERDLILFIEEIVPDYDKKKVYPSDIKKLVLWYHLLLKHSPATFDTLLKEESKEEEALVEESKEKESAQAEKPEKESGKKKKSDEKVAEKTEEAVESKAEKKKTKESKSEVKTKESGETEKKPAKTEKKSEEKPAKSSGGKGKKS